MSSSDCQTTWPPILTDFASLQAKLNDRYVHAGQIDERHREAGQVGVFALYEYAIVRALGADAGIDKLRPEEHWESL